MKFSQCIISYDALNKVSYYNIFLMCCIMLPLATISATPMCKCKSKCRNHFFLLDASRQFSIPEKEVAATVSCFVFCNLHMRLQFVSPSYILCVMHIGTLSSGREIIDKTIFWGICHTLAFLHKQKSKTPRGNGLAYI